MLSRRWCFTSYAENICHGDLGGTGHVLPEHARYAIFQRERCPETGRLHWQGYIEFTGPMRMRKVQRLICDERAHMEPARGDRNVCRDYCRKEESRESPPVELGEFTRGGQGTRNDIGAVLDVIRREPIIANAVRILYDDHGPAMVRYPRGIQAAIQHYASRKTREGPPTVFVHIGEPGSGKTRAVYDNHDMHDVWRAPVSTSNVQWFDGYANHPIVLLDDFDGHHPSITVMLQALDRYPLQVPVKGSHVNWVPTTIYITTNIPFKDWYPEAAEVHRRALKRRITEIIQFTALGDEYDSDAIVNIMDD